MKLKDFVSKSLEELSDLQGGVVEFDVAVEPLDDKILVSHDASAVGLSRIKFSVKVEVKGKQK